MMKAKPIFLFEFGNSCKLKWEEDKVSRFMAFLEEVWENRSRSGILSEWYQAEEEPIYQPLLQLRHERKATKVDFSVRACNYVGIIRFEGQTFHLLPKLFKEIENEEEALKRSNAHLLWWLSYNRWLNLPKQITGLSYQSCDFLEILIYLFATYTLEQLHKGPYHAYQEMEAETTYLKGQLIFSEYTAQYLGRANYQKLYCRYDSFEVDNQLNRIIKYVSRLLCKHTQLAESRKTLNLILHQLDEVSDEKVNAIQCDKVVLNTMFSEYQLVLGYCKMFLQGFQTTLSHDQDDAFAFLVPMEKVFEEFVLGFMDRELKPHIEVTGQYQRHYLTTNKKFRLRPDLYIRNVCGEQPKAFLADTKYKLIYGKDKGIFQTDLYQMLAYAVRHKTDHINILYPEWQNQQEYETTSLEVKDEFAAPETQIKFRIHKLSVVAHRDIDSSSISIEKFFQDTAEKLRRDLIDIFT